VYIALIKGERGEEGKRVKSKIITNRVRAMV
jgi:hypothetical protein